MLYKIISLFLHTLNGALSVIGEALGSVFLWQNHALITVEQNKYDTVVHGFVRQFGQTAGYLTLKELSQVKIDANGNLSVPDRIKPVLQLSHGCLLLDITQGFLGSNAAVFTQIDVLQTWIKHHNPNLKLVAVATPESLKSFGVDMIRRFSGGHIHQPRLQVERLKPIPFIQAEHVPLTHLKTVYMEVSSETQLDDLLYGTLHCPPKLKAGIELYIKGLTQDNPGLKKLNVILSQGGFYYKGEWVSTEGTSAKCVHGQFQSVKDRALSKHIILLHDLHSATDYPPASQVITGNCISDLLSEQVLKDGVIVDRTDWPKTFILATSLTDNQWELLMTHPISFRIAVLPNVQIPAKWENLVDTKNFFSPSQKPGFQHTVYSTEPFAAAAHLETQIPGSIHVHITAHTTPNELSFFLQNDTGLYREIPSEFFTENLMNKDKTVIFSGLETNPELADWLKTVLLPKPFVVIHGQPHKILARVIVVQLDGQTQPARYDVLESRILGPINPENQDDQAKLSRFKDAFRALETIQTTVLKNRQWTAIQWEKALRVCMTVPHSSAYGSDSRYAFLKRILCEPFRSEPLVYAELKQALKTAFSKDSEVSLADKLKKRVAFQLDVLNSDLPKVVVLEGSPGSGKTQSLTNIRTHFSDRHIPVHVHGCTVGPGTTSEQLLGFWDIQTGTFKPGIVGNWALDKRTGKKILHLNELNLLQQGECDWLYGLAKHPPEIMLGGKIVQLSEDHYVVITQNPSTEVGRVDHAVLKDVGTLIRYRPMKDNEFASHVIAPLCSDYDIAGTDRDEFIQTLMQVRHFFGSNITARDMETWALHAAHHFPAVKHISEAIVRGVMDDIGGKLSPEQQKTFTEFCQKTWHVSPRIQALPEAETMVSKFLSRGTVVKTQTTRDFLVQIANALIVHNKGNQHSETRGKTGILVEGFPGTGKDDIPRQFFVFLKELYPEFLPGLTVNEMVCGLQKSDVDAAILHTVETPQLLHLSEVGLLPKGALEQHHSILEGQGGNPESRSFFYLTRNPANVGFSKSRTEDSSAFLNRFICIQRPNYTAEDLFIILEAQKLPEAVAEKAIELLALHETITTHQTLSRQDIIPSPAEFFKALELLSKGCELAIVIERVYSPYPKLSYTVAKERWQTAYERLHPKPKVVVVEPRHQDHIQGDVVPASPQQRSVVVPLSNSVSPVRVQPQHEQEHPERTSFLRGFFGRWGRNRHAVYPAQVETPPATRSVIDANRHVSSGLFETQKNDNEHRVVGQFKGTQHHQDLLNQLVIPDTTKTTMTILKAPNNTGDVFIQTERYDTLTFSDLPADQRKKRWILPTPIGYRPHSITVKGVHGVQGIPNTHIKQDKPGRYFIPMEAAPRFTSVSFSLGQITSSSFLIKAYTSAQPKHPKTADALALFNALGTQFTEFHSVLHHHGITNPTDIRRLTEPVREKLADALIKDFQTICQYTKGREELTPHQQNAYTRASKQGHMAIALCFLNLKVGVCFESAIAFNLICRTLLGLPMVIADTRLSIKGESVVEYGHVNNVRIYPNGTFRVLEQTPPLRIQPSSSPVGQTFDMDLASTLEFASQRVSTPTVTQKSEPVEPVLLPATDRVEIPPFTAPPRVYRTLSETLPQYERDVFIRLGLATEEIAFGTSHSTTGSELDFSALRQGASSPYVNKKSVTMTCTPKRIYVDAHRLQPVLRQLEAFGFEIFVITESQPEFKVQPLATAVSSANQSYHVGVFQEFHCTEKDIFLTGSQISHIKALLDRNMAALSNRGDFDVWSPFIIQYKDQFEIAPLIRAATGYLGIQNLRQSPQIFDVLQHMLATPRQKDALRHELMKGNLQQERIRHLAYRTPEELTNTEHVINCLGLGVTDDQLEALQKPIDGELLSVYLNQQLPLFIQIISDINSVEVFQALSRCITFHLNHDLLECVLHHPLHKDIVPIYLENLKRQVGDHYLEKVIRFLIADSPAHWDLLALFYSSPATTRIKLLINRLISDTFHEQLDAIREELNKIDTDPFADKIMVLPKPVQTQFLKALDAIRLKRTRSITGRLSTHDNIQNIIKALTLVPEFEQWAQLRMPVQGFENTDI